MKRWWWWPTVIAVWIGLAEGIPVLWDAGGREAWTWVHAQADSLAWIGVYLDALAAWPKRPERAYMDIVKNIQRTHEVSTPTGPVGPKRPGGDGHTAHLHVIQPLWPLRGRFRTWHRLREKGGMSVMMGIPVLTGRVNTRCPRFPVHFGWFPRLMDQFMSRAHPK